MNTLPPLPRHPDHGGGRRSKNVTGHFTQVVNSAVLLRGNVRAGVALCVVLEFHACPKNEEGACSLECPESSAMHLRVILPQKAPTNMRALPAAYDI